MNNIREHELFYLNKANKHYDDVKPIDETHKIDSTDSNGGHNFLRTPKDG